MEIGSVEDVEKIQSDLNEANVWSRLWNLLFNESKSVHLCYSKQGLTDTHNYTLNGSEVIQKETHRDLGIIMCADLSWNSHCVSLCQKSYKILGLLCRSFSNHSVKVRKQLYLTLVRSKITYCSPIWRPNLIKDIDMLEKIQRRATKYILSDYVSDYKCRLTSLGILPLMMFFELQDIVLFVKSLKYPSTSFNVLDYVTFSSNSTRSSESGKLNHNYWLKNKILRSLLFQKITTPMECTSNHQS